SPSLRSETLRAAYARPEEKLVAYMGRLAPEKQVEDLKIIHDMPGVRLLIVGDGPEKEALRRLMPRAHFVGFRTGTDLAAHVASADLFIHPGELETFGQTLQEAMASGLPVIAPRRGGPVDLIAPSRTGWLYTPGLLDELRDRATDLRFDDAKRRAFRRAAEASGRKRPGPGLGRQWRGCFLQGIEQRGRFRALPCSARAAPVAAAVRRRHRFLRAAPPASASPFARLAAAAKNCTQSKLEILAYWI